MCECLRACARARVCVRVRVRVCVCVHVRVGGCEYVRGYVRVCAVFVRE